VTIVIERMPVGPSSDIEATARKLSVLVVEDSGGAEHWIDKTLRPACNRGAMVLRTARNLAEATTALKDLAADCVLIDFDLANAGGAFCIEAIRAADADVAVVVMSRFDEDNYAGYAFKFGAQDYVVKGELDGDQLLRRLRFAVRRHRHVRENANNEGSDLTTIRDPLTGLPNLQLFEDHARVAIAQARRLGSHLGLISIEVEGIYTASDLHGEAAGHNLLRHVTQVICETVRGSDIVARTGGNEFALLLSMSDTSPDPTLIAQRLVDRLGSVRQVGDNSVQLICSAGIAVFPEHGSTVETLLYSGAAASYEARRRGGGVWRFVPEFVQTRTSRLIQSEIAEALEGDQFTLYFQPWCDAEQRAWAGVEVLLRWKDERRLRSAAEFIAEAERSGQIRDLGAIVMQRACEQWHRWRAAGLDVGTLALNISDAELRDARHLANLVGNVAASGLPPSRLQLELRAAAFTPGDEELARSVAVLRENGFRVVADGVTAETSALDALTAIPIDGIKFDRGVTRALVTEGVSGRLHRFVGAVLSAASHLDVDVAATGVESEYDCAALMSTGCRWLQGRWLGEATSSAGMPKVWRRRVVLPKL